MLITKEAIVGTLESSDIMIKVQPADAIIININSTVDKQFGQAIKSTIKDVLIKFNIDKIEVDVDDKGALDCVIQARLKAAILKATDEKINWGDVL